MNDATPQAMKPRCNDWSPPWFRGAWRDWHRGHGCHLDDGKPRSQAGVDEIAAHEAQSDPRRT